MNMHGKNVSILDRRTEPKSVIQLCMQFLSPMTSLYSCIDITILTAAGNPSDFLDASSHLYMSVCPSVGPSVRPSVRRSRVCNAFVKNARKSFISPFLSLPFNALCLFNAFMPFQCHSDASLACWALLFLF